jgi:hypothetical protein
MFPPSRRPLAIALGGSYFPQDSRHFVPGTVLSLRDKNHPQSVAGSIHRTIRPGVLLGSLFGRRCEEDRLEAYATLGRRVATAGSRR